MRSNRIVTASLSWEPNVLVAVLWHGGLIVVVLGVALKVGRF